MAYPPFTRHIRYQNVRGLHCPLSRGMIESACKLLIQQRCKDVGMCWSKEGFNIFFILFGICWLAKAMSG
ncbi:MAG: hypothetical protein HC790_07520 [Acaryochloridaceae cyanobacterium CSU_3_4]|nr:hypothetical protein [Acaryochloridaceae cyanobacterium CSU_3_4]